jgi:hypothetical protein
MLKVSIWAMYAVAAAAILLGVAILIGWEPGRTAEALIIIGVGVATAAWTHSTVPKGGAEG